jgi:HAD superfamily hydrolase (TIGR01490 family)
MYKLKVVSAEVTIHRLARWFKGKEEKEIEEFTKELYDTRLKPKIRPGALDILTYHRERGAELILLTASTPYTCVPMIKDLDLHHCLCSEMEVVQGYFSGKPLMPYCYGPEKKTRASEFCQSRGYDLASAWYYGDSHADIHIMEAVGNAVCVNPDKKLQAAAKSRGWKIVSW